MITHAAPHQSEIVLETDALMHASLDVGEMYVHVFVNGIKSPAVWPAAILNICIYTLTRVVVLSTPNKHF